MTLRVTSPMSHPGRSPTSGRSGSAMLPMTRRSCAGRSRRPAARPTSSGLPGRSQRSTASSAASPRSCRGGFRHAGHRALACRHASRSPAGGPLSRPAGGPAPDRRDRCARPHAGAARPLRRGPVERLPIPPEMAHSDLPEAKKAAQVAADTHLAARFPALMERESPTRGRAARSSGREAIQKCSLSRITHGKPRATRSWNSRGCRGRRARNTTLRMPYASFPALVRRWDGEAARPLPAPGRRGPRMKGRPGE